MGTLIRARCGNCGYHEEFHIGSGMQDWDINIIRNALAQNDVIQFDALAAGGMKSVSMNRQLGICEKCNKWIIIPSVICGMADGTEKKIRNHCPLCGSLRVKTLEWSKPEEKIACPECEAELEIIPVGLWD